MDYCNKDQIYPQDNSYNFCVSDFDRDGHCGNYKPCCAGCCRDGVCDPNCGGHVNGNGDH